LKQKSTTLAPQKNKKAEATITVDNLVSTMKTSMPSEKILRENDISAAGRGYNLYGRQQTKAKNVLIR
jgi:hypothetical protein